MLAAVLNFYCCLGDHYSFWSFLNLTLDKIAIIAEPILWGLKGYLSLLKNRRSGRLSP